VPTSKIKGAEGLTKVHPREDLATSGLPAPAAGASLARARARPAFFRHPLAWLSSKAGQRLAGRCKMRRHAANDVGCTGYHRPARRRPPKIETPRAPAGVPHTRGLQQAGDQDYALARGYKPSLCQAGRRHGWPDPRDPLRHRSAGQTVVPGEANGGPGFWRGLPAFLGEDWAMRFRPATAVRPAHARG
jgi:hypothetical protein